MASPGRAADPRPDLPRRSSPVQCAYWLDQANFLAGLRDRAQRLAECGYTVALTDVPHQFQVRHPEGDGERAYTVDPVAQTCTCPFFQRQQQEPLTDHGTPVPCKHLLGLAGLLAHTRADRPPEGPGRRSHSLTAPRRRRRPPGRRSPPARPPRRFLTARPPAVPIPTKGE
jgi:hypothetical protein